MNKIIFVLLFTIIFSFPGNSHQDKSTKIDDVSATALQFVNLLIQQKFDDATSKFNDTVKSKLSAEGLKSVWLTQLTQLGEFQKIIRTRSDIVKQYRVAYVTCQFKNVVIDIQLTFDNTDKIAGLFFIPAKSVVEYSPPAYIKPSNFYEEEVTVGEDEWKLPGTLTIPAGDGIFPAVILVHGSGPNDRDETVGANKPFRDIAGGLASSGIAVLRYEKRTKQYREKILSLQKGFTVNEETIEDALRAFSFLKNHKKVNSKKIFILGHSLGGMLLPRIGTKNPEFTGLIIMAGASSKPIEDKIVDQIEYLISLDSMITKEENEELTKIKVKVKMVKSKDLSPETSSEKLPLGIPASYWFDLRNYNPVAIAQKLNVPMLILQGERDYQNSMMDFIEWKKALSSKQNVTFKSYSDLNHLFIKGTGRSSPAEYNVSGNVSETVVGDIVKWIKSQL